MLDKFDYTEPDCPFCSGKAFYHPEKDAPLGEIPIGRIIEKADALFYQNRPGEAERLLVYWKNEALALRDKRGELAVESELVGYYRKQANREAGLASVARALALIAELEQEDTVSGATILINCATAYKAFEMADAALPLYKRAEAVYQTRLPADDARFGGLYNNMALALVDLGQFDAAENAYFSALAVMKQVQNGEAECAITQLNLAHMYDDCGKSERVRPCLEAAYALLQSEHLPHDGYYAFVLEKCAPSFAYFGDTARYTTLSEEAKRIYARS